MIFNKVINFSKHVIHRLEVTGVSLPNSQTDVPWQDYVYFSDTYRRAHVNIVDAREERNLWMMHCCVFPHINDPSPIYGLDIIAGPSRISGAFHDFSKTVDSKHAMMHWFEDQVNQLTWKKPRELPDWALEIFSPSIVAIGAVNTEQETDQLISLFDITLEYYLKNVGIKKNLGSDYTLEQNRYCYYQKKNPHNPRFMQLLGLNEKEALDYVDNVMFPEIE